MLSRLLKFLKAPLGLTDALVLFCFLSLSYVELSEFAGDPGVGWHLKDGEYIWTHLSIPRFDPFLASAAPRTWVSDQWLSDLIFFLLYKVGSWPLLYAFIILVFGAGFLWILRNGLAKLTSSYLLSALGLLAAFKLGEIHFILRPVALSFLFFIFVYLKLIETSRLARSGAEINKSSSLVMLPFVFLVWANLHPSFVLGLLLIFFMGGSFLLDRFIVGSKVSEQNYWRNLKFAALLFTLCLVATLVNPYGIDLHRSIVELGRSSYFMNLHLEWHSPNFKESEGALLIAIFCFSLISLVLAGSASLGWGIFEILSILFFTVSALRALRMLPFFGIIAALPITELAQNLANSFFFKTNKVWLTLKPSFERLERRERERTNRGSLVFILISSAILLSAACYQRVLFFDGPFGPTARTYPYKAVDFLLEQAHKLHKENLVIAASPNWGGFITFKGEGKLVPILDDRNTLVGEDFYKGYEANFLRAGQGWREYLKPFGTSYILVNPQEPLNRLIKQDAALELMYQDDVAIVYKYG